MAAAVLTGLTLFFLAWTVRQQGKSIRQQGKALNLQIAQMEADKALRDEESRRKAEEARTRRLSNARMVRINSLDMAWDPSPYNHRPDTYFDAVEELLHSEMVRQHGHRKWWAAAIKVRNGSPGEILNLNFYAQNFPRPAYVWRQGAPSLVSVAELDSLATASEVTFIWPEMTEKQLQEIHPELQFSDEDGYRWRTDFEAQAARVDDPNG
ncbi:hypothetical protein [Microtetraspora malaysiensis]|uniref:Uncharacterized protein n=1 Tax=Microtetraspora malaysiensis TaxID=161358 RepID=A0ABW6T344_9ACTN